MRVGKLLGAARPQFSLEPASKKVLPLFARLLSCCNARCLPPPAVKECFLAIIRFHLAASRVLARCRIFLHKAICSFLLVRALLSSIPGASACSFRHITFRLSKTQAIPEIGSLPKRSLEKSPRSRRSLLRVRRHALP